LTTASTRNRTNAPAPGSDRRWLAPILALLLLQIVFTSLWGQGSEPRLVAIGDIHGAASEFESLLQQLELTDTEHRWAGGSSILVQAGDFTDRGPRVRDVMDLLRRLEVEAADADGRTHVLLGNHETMNLMANVRDATAEIFGTFASDGALERQEAAYRMYERWTGDRAEVLGHPMPGRQTREEWMQTHPPGFVEYMEAFGPDGEYGRWLRSKPIAVALRGTIFVHGGLHPDGAATSVEALNTQAREEIARFDRDRQHLIARGVILPFSTFPEIVMAARSEFQAWVIRLAPGPPNPDAPPPLLSPEDREHLRRLIDLQTADRWSLIDPNGPVWFRGFAQWSVEEGEAAIGEVLERFGVVRAVVGHTVTASRRITPRFGDRVFLIDTGMLAIAYRGVPSALEITDNRVSAVHAGERTVLSEEAR
jgi:hypothetical protein